MVSCVLQVHFQLAMITAEIRLLISVQSALHLSGGSMRDTDDDNNDGSVIHTGRSAISRAA